MDFTAADGNS